MKTQFNNCLFGVSFKVKRRREFYSIFRSLDMYSWHSVFENCLISSWSVTFWSQTWFFHSDYLKSRLYKWIYFPVSSDNQCSTVYYLLSLVTHTHTHTHKRTRLLFDQPNRKILQSRHRESRYSPDATTGKQQSARRSFRVKDQIPLSTVIICSHDVRRVRRVVGWMVVAETAWYGMR